jgi:hypothetical protein
LARLDRAEPSLQKLGVHVFTYQTSIQSRTYSIADVSDALREHFNIAHLWDAQNLIFVCHSMGGIVVRRFLVANQVRFISQRPKLGLFLVESPSLGSRDANLLSLLSYLFQHSQAAALRFSQSNTSLDDLHRDFRTLLNSGQLSIVGRELTEDKPIVIKRWLGIHRQVVEPFSAAAYFHEPGHEPFRVPGSDHVTIVKPLSKDAIQHQMLKSFLLEFTNSDPKTSSRIGLEGKQTAQATYPKQSWHQADASSQVPPELEQAFGVPPLTRRMIVRQSFVDRICTKVASAGHSSPRACFLHGPGGAGKSTLAIMVAQTEIVRSTYPDGRFWISLGQDPEISNRQAVWLSYISNRPAGLSTPEATAAYLSTYFKDKEALLIIDDVWDASDMTFFAVGGPKCGLLITSREMKLASVIDAHVLAVGTLTPDEASELISIRSDHATTNDELLRTLVATLGNLPLALELAAYQ